MIERNLAETLGARLRTRRLKLGYSQELAAEKADLHPTYIGQVERGEKNATITSIERICSALDYPMEELFAHISDARSLSTPAHQCYDLIVNLPIKEQRQLYVIIENIIKYKNS